MKMIKFLILSDGGEIIAHELISSARRPGGQAARRPGGRLTPE